MTELRKRLLHSLPQTELSSGTEGRKALTLSGKMDITHKPLGEQRDHDAAEDLNPRGQRQQRWTRRRTNGAAAMIDYSRRPDNQYGRLLTCPYVFPPAGGVGQGGVVMVRTAPPTDLISGRVLCHILSNPLPAPPTQHTHKKHTKKITEHCFSHVAPCHRFPNTSMSCRVSAGS